MAAWHREQGVLSLLLARPQFSTIFDYVVRSTETENTNSIFKHINIYFLSISARNYVIISWARGHTLLTQPLGSQVSVTHIFHLCIVYLTADNREVKASLVYIVLGHPEVHSKTLSKKQKFKCGKYVIIMYSYY